MLAFRAPWDRLRFRTALLWRARLDQLYMTVRWSRMAIGRPRCMMALEKQLVVIYVPAGTANAIGMLTAREPERSTAPWQNMVVAIVSRNERG
jgi:hypothetical protein